MSKVISECCKIDFENEVNQLLAQGYKISSSSCGWNSINDCDYYIAILVKEDSKDNMN